MEVELDNDKLDRENLAGGQVLCEEDVPGCDVSVDEALPGQVAEAISHLLAVGEEGGGHTGIHHCTRTAGTHRERVSEYNFLLSLS